RNCSGRLPSQSVREPSLVHDASDREHESFSGLLLRHRARTRLTQRELASRVGVSMRSVQGWENGLMYPGAGRLQALMAALLEADGLTQGHEWDEAEALWAAVDREASRAHPPFERSWFTGLFGNRENPQLTRRSVQAPPEETPTRAQPIERTQDWGDAPT